MIQRYLEKRLIEALKNMPAVALLGSRQVGKTTLAHAVVENELQKNINYLDLESAVDMAKLNDAEAYLSQFEGQLMIIDEVQLKPELFKVLRGLIDKRKRAGEKSAQFLLLGSASRDLLQQSSETLAGRIRYLELSPFQAIEISNLDNLAFSPEKLWFRGGFPDSFLASNDNESWNWRTDFIATYVERDIPQIGINVSSTRIRKFWTMLAHFHGQQINMSSLAKSLEVSHTTIKNYLDILTELFMVRQLQPWSGNTKKRLVKSPKIYIRDTGLLHRLLSISDFDSLLGNPVLGHSWEGFVVENILNALSDKWQASYYRTAEQTEIDLILEKSDEKWAIEIKRSSAPKLPKGFLRASEDIGATKKYLLYSGNEQFPMAEDTIAIGLIDFVKLIEE
jgi:uncharacterized protein